MTSCFVLLGAKHGSSNSSLPEFPDFILVGKTIRVVNTKFILFVGPSTQEPRGIMTLKCLKDQKETPGVRFQSPQPKNRSNVGHPEQRFCKSQGRRGIFCQRRGVFSRPPQGVSECRISVLSNLTWCSFEQSWKGYPQKKRRPFAWGFLAPGVELQ